jgi:hypothetical protein
MVFEDMFKVKASCFFRVDISSSRTEMSHLGEAVNTDEDCVESSRWRQLNDEVHRYRRPRCWGNREGVELAMTLAPRYFVSSTGIACINVVINELSHSGPVVIASDELKGFFLTEMSRGY